jgi:hypothetical protein
MDHVAISEVADALNEDTQKESKDYLNHIFSEGI